MKKFAAGILLISALIFGGTGERFAAASKAARVQTDDGKIYEGPGTQFEVVEEVKKGTIVVVSNLPIQGFYKVRLADGKLGFISGETIAIYTQGGPTMAPMQPAPEPRARSAKSAPLPTEKSPTSYSGPDLSLQAEGPPLNLVAEPVSESSPAPAVPPVVPAGNSLSGLDSFLAEPAPSPTPVPPPLLVRPSARKMPVINPQAPHSQNEVTDQVGLPMGAAPEDAPVPSDPEVGEPSHPMESKESLGAKRDSLAERPPIWAFRLFGGVSPISLSQVNSLYLNGNAPSTTYHFGLETLLALDEDWVFLFRLERTIGNSSAGVYSFQVAGWPVMFGLGYNLTKDEGARLRLSALFGAALKADLSATDNQAGAPNTTVIQTAEFAEMLKLDFTKSLGKHLGLFAEAGYRFMQSGSASVTAPGPGGQLPNGASIFTSGSNGFVPVTIDLSGPVLSAGVSVSF